MKSLRDVIDGRAELNAQERDSLFTLLSTRCRAKTKDKLRARIDLLGPAFSNYVIYGRVLFRDKWDGVQTTSYFTGIVVRWHREFEFVVVGRYFV